MSSVTISSRTSMASIRGRSCHGRCFGIRLDACGGVLPTAPTTYVPVVQLRFACRTLAIMTERDRRATLSLTLTQESQRRVWRLQHCKSRSRRLYRNHRTQHIHLPSWREALYQTLDVRLVSSRIRSLRSACWMAAGCAHIDEGVGVVGMLHTFTSLSI